MQTENPTQSSLRSGHLGIKLSWIWAFAPLSSDALSLSIFPINTCKFKGHRERFSRDHRLGYSLVCNLGFCFLFNVSFYFIHVTEIREEFHGRMRVKLVLRRYKLFFFPFIFTLLNLSYVFMFFFSYFSSLWFWW